MNRFLHPQGLWLVCLLFFLTSCEEEGFFDKNGEEILVTTVQLVLTRTAPTDDVAKTFTWKHLSGTSANNAAGASVDSIFLVPNATYTFDVTLLDETAGVTDFTSELGKKKHALTLTPGEGLALTHNASDNDKDEDKDNDNDIYGRDKSVGFEGTVSTQGASKGTLQLRLLHEKSDKDEHSETGDDHDGESGDSSEEAKKTLVDVLFPVRIAAAVTQ